jgi:hypothetical protein
MNIQKIIHEGNLNYARKHLAKDYLGIGEACDIELIGLTLTRLEQTRPLISQQDYEAYELLSLLIETMPPTDFQAALFQSRYEAISFWIHRPFLVHADVSQSVEVN